MFIVDLTPGFNGLGKYNCKTRRETYTFWDLLHIIWIRFGWGRFGYELLWGRLGWGRFGVGPFWPVTHYISGVAVVFEDKWPQDITMMRLFAKMRDKALSENTMTQWDTNLFTHHFAYRCPRNVCYVMRALATYRMWYMCIPKLTVIVFDFQLLYE